jgi:antitoxin VapB
VFRNEVNMALSIKTTEADALASSLSRLTGETITEAVTAALRERLQRERRRRAAQHGLIERGALLAVQLRANYDTRPVTREEWDEV